MTLRSPLTALAVLVAGIATAAAAPETPGAASTAGPLARYQARLQGDAERILAPEVSGTTKTAVSARGGDLWTALSVAEWQARLVEAAPILDKAAKVLARRSEVIWSEERVVDAYASPILQMASVHALQRGLSRVLEQLGVAMPAPEPRAATRPAIPSGIAASMRPEPAPAAAEPVAARTTRAEAPREAPVLSPREIAAYRVALERESFRILTPEFDGGGVVAAMSERKANLSRATTVAAWRATLSAGAPSLAKAGAVLERRAEVLRGEGGVRDAYESPAVQRAAVQGLEAGLERILRQFGR